MSLYLGNSSIEITLGLLQPDLRVHGKFGISTISFNLCLLKNVVYIA